MASTKSLVVESALPLSCAVAAESASEAGLGVVAQRRQEPSCSDRRCFPFRGTDARERQSRASQLQSTLEMNACTALGFAGLPRRPDSTMSRKMYFTCAVSVIDSSGQRLAVKLRAAVRGRPTVNGLLGGPFPLGAVAAIAAPTAIPTIPIRPSPCTPMNKYPKLGRYAYGHGKILPAMAPAVPKTETAYNPNARSCTTGPLRPGTQTRTAMAASAPAAGPARMMRNGIRKAYAQTSTMTGAKTSDSRTLAVLKFTGSAQLFYPER